MNYIAGLCKKAEEYMVENSNFIPYTDTSTQKIGCKRSDGVINTNASMYKKVELNDGIIALFKYILKDNIVVYEVVQECKNDVVFLSLETDSGKAFKWTSKEMITFVKKYEQL
jgi:hypothetical protein